MVEELESNPHAMEAMSEIKVASVTLRRSGSMIAKRLRRMINESAEKAWIESTITSAKRLLGKQ